MAPAQENDQLKKELLGLFNYIQRVRHEIAAINRPTDEDNRFEKMGDQLDAIVLATEEATNAIMESVERNQEALTELKNLTDDPKQLDLLDIISKSGNDIFEACSFQDITGQRVSKVIKSVTYVESKVNSLIEIWGKSVLEQIEVMDDERTEEEKMIHGPSLADEKSFSQAEIDALFD